MTEQSLEEFNKEGIIRNFISAEEHALMVSPGRDTWCLQKHLKFSGYGHHYLELLQLTEKSNPDFNRKLKRFGNKWRNMIDTKSYSASNIRDLRNEFREISGDPTLSQSKEKCGVCSLDRLKGSSFSSSSTEIDIRSDPQQSSNKALWIIGGIVLFGAILLIANSKK